MCREPKASGLAARLAMDIAPAIYRATRWTITHVIGPGIVVAGATSWRYLSGQPLTDTTRAQRLTQLQRVAVRLPFAMTVLVAFAEPAMALLALAAGLTTTLAGASSLWLLRAPRPDAPAPALTGQLISQPALATDPDRIRWSDLTPANDGAWTR